MDILINLLVGLVASVLTLIGDRCLTRWWLERRIRWLTGKYRIVPASNSSGRKTDKETISIEHLHGRRFSIRSTGSGVGEWSGQFSIGEDHPEYGRGTYSHTGYVGWGNHEFQIQTDTGRILVSGDNRDRAGTVKQFSYILEKAPEPGVNTATANNTQVSSEAAPCASPYEPTV